MKIQTQLNVDASIRDVVLKNTFVKLYLPTPSHLLCVWPIPSLAAVRPWTLCDLGRCATLDAVRPWSLCDLGRCATIIVKTWVCHSPPLSVRERTLESAAPNSWESTQGKLLLFCFLPIRGANTSYILCAYPRVWHKKLGNQERGKIRVCVYPFKNTAT